MREIKEIRVFFYVEGPTELLACYILINCGLQWVNVRMNITVLMFLTRRIQQSHAGGRDPVNRRQIYYNIWHRVSENPLL